jgi:PAS domain S-box-containing protein
MEQRPHIIADTSRHDPAGDADFSRILLKESPDAAIVLSTTGHILHWSPTAEAMFGFSGSEVTGRLLTDLVVPTEHLGEERQILDRILSQGGATHESIRRCKDGTLIYAAISGKLVERSQDGTCVIVMTQKDVTQLKVQRDAKLVEARYRDVLESMPDGIIMVNATGRIVFSNTQAERLFGYDAGTLRGTLIEQLLPDRLRARHLEHRSHYLGQPRARPMGIGLELYGLRRDGSEFPVEISLSPLKTEDSTLVSAAVRDITERKRFERALQEKNLELAAANQAKDRFLANMSHELRTPLNAIIGFTGTLLMKLPGPLTSEQERQLRTVKLSAAHLLALINDLLDVAKIEAGKFEVTPAVIDLTTVLEEVATTLQPSAEAKGLRFVLVLPATPVVFAVDRRAFSQIVLNLLTNAIKFTDRGEITIALECRSEEGRQIVGVTVCDTGVGIAQADLERLFEPFSRVGSDRERMKEGTGLGLHLSQKLAGLIGGRIAVRSVFSQGSAFTLTLEEPPR